jgi:hypothetical protein
MTSINFIPSALSRLSTLAALSSGSRKIEAGKSFNQDGFKEDIPILLSNHFSAMLNVLIAPGVFTTGPGSESVPTWYSWSGHTARKAAFEVKALIFFCVLFIFICTDID